MVMCRCAIFLLVATPLTLVSDLSLKRGNAEIKNKTKHNYKMPFISVTIYDDQLVYMQTTGCVFYKDKVGRGT